MLACNQIVAIRRPGRVVEQTKIFFRHLVGVFTVAIHYPDVVAAPCIAGKTDTFTVGTESGLYFVGRTLSQGNRLTTLYRNKINITEHIKDNFFTTWADIKIHPGAFVGGENQRIHRTMNFVDVPFFSFSPARRSVGIRTAVKMNENRRIPSSICEFKNCSD